MGGCPSYVRTSIPTAPVLCRAVCRSGTLLVRAFELELVPGLLDLRCGGGGAGLVRRPPAWVDSFALARRALRLARVRRAPGERPNPPTRCPLSAVLRLLFSSRLHPAATSEVAHTGSCVWVRVLLVAGIVRRVCGVRRRRACGAILDRASSRRVFMVTVYPSFLPCLFSFSAIFRYPSPLSSPTYLHPPFSQIPRRPARRGLLHHRQFHHQQLQLQLRLHRRRRGAHRYVLAGAGEAEAQHRRWGDREWREWEWRRGGQAPKRPRGRPRGSKAAAGRGRRGWRDWFFGLFRVWFWGWCTIVLYCRVRLLSTLRYLCRGIYCEPAR
ncbi:hypothetical protein B0H10DRAFT_866151 [Mycena sp. CBHHK59/15]|nr:hypothetical protein B0H10DRAFT_866151 [Mycena sp. CBHHK59/15]